MKSCKITKLDDTFWRVDWEGGQAVYDGRVILSPAILERDRESYCLGGVWFDSPDEALTMFDLTTEQPKDETAEERVRRIAEWDYADGSVLAGEGREEVTFGDLRAILAELDRLRAQKPVDIDAVLAPVRALHAAFLERHEALLTAESTLIEYSMDSVAKLVGERSASLWGLAQELRNALAEAEKIGRGE